MMQSHGNQDLRVLALKMESKAIKKPEGVTPDEI
jgi:hypothetical protein